MALLSRELTFMIMLGTSVAIGGIVRLLSSSFIYKKELMSIVGLLQIMWFCGYDTVHLLIMMTVGITIIQSKLFGPRTVFVYCFLHRLFFSSSKFFGLPRDESNLANAAMFISTLKMIIVAYEVSDFEKSKKDSEYQTKWINLKNKPSTPDLFCYMTCFAAVFTGPIYRYKTYHDMLYTYHDVPVRSEVLSKLKTCALLYVLFFLLPFNVSVYKGAFYEYSFAIRYCVMIAVVFTQVLKYAIAWLLAECVCLLIGLGAYPVSGKSMPGMGPLNRIEVRPHYEYDFETISTIKTWESVKAPTIKGTLQSWNNCTQWWLAYFIYSSRILPRNWRIARAFNVMIISAAWHGIKLGYFMSFPMLVIFLFAEDIWKKEVEGRIVWKSISYVFKALHWFFVKMGGITFLFTVFVLQDYDKIIRFCTSMHFYGYVLPFALLITVLLVKFITPNQHLVKLN